MTKTELEKLYRMACDGKGYQPDDGQFKVWKLTLMWAEEKDLAQALVWFFQTEQGFPMPAQLKTLAEKARRERLARAVGDETYTVYVCAECGTRVGSWRPDFVPRACKGHIGSIRNDPDYGKVCTSTSFNLLSREVFSKGSAGSH